MKANVKVLLDEMRWSNSKAGRIFGVHRNTVANWVKAGEAPQAVVLFLELLHKHRELLRAYE